MNSFVNHTLQAIRYRSDSAQQSNSIGHRQFVPGARSVLPHECNTSRTVLRQCIVAAMSSRYPTTKSTSTNQLHQSTCECKYTDPKNIFGMNYQNFDRKFDSHSQETFIDQCGHSNALATNIFFILFALCIGHIL